ncbi:MAG: DEAD/DEAH box helicase family protein, partial [Bacteroidota bacterium]
MLKTAGWVIQDMKALNLVAALGVAIREFQTDAGPADYMLFVDAKPVGVLEAKKEGVLLATGVEEQSSRYAKAGFRWKKDSKVLPFVYESTGAITQFTDMRDPKPRSREIYSFPKPETLNEWLTQPTSLRERLTEFPPLDETGLRACQINAIRNLEKSFSENRPRALIQMATGSGKTYTAITSIYRILKAPIQGKRVLFLVDTKNLGEQAEQEFQAYIPRDDQRTFSELYPVQRLQSHNIDPASKVCISTIQRMYSILRGEEMDESLEQDNPNERKAPKKLQEIQYNPEVPPETFDFIVIDECHRSIYNLWRQVLEYFDAFLVGLTATPDTRTFAFFNENVVSEYTHQEAVRDGVNVGFEVYNIETKIAKQGAEVKKAGYSVGFRSRQNRKMRWSQVDEDTRYTDRELDRSVVNPSQIRTVIKTFREKLFLDLFPGRTVVPKSLIFAKTDSHAEDIIKIVREEFAEGNEFCKKVTYQSKENPKSVIAQFRNEYHPRIAVTVDMIATGTDIKPLECLIFMRDVRSNNYYEQMKGRGTRTLDAEGMKKVNADAKGPKTHFILVDAVGVEASRKVTSQPLERRRSISFKDLMLNVAMGEHDEDTFSSLAGRMARLKNQVASEKLEKVKELTGKEISEIVEELLNAHDPDIFAQRLEEAYKDFEDRPTPAQAEELQSKIAKAAAAPFNLPAVRDFLDNVRRIQEQIIDTQNLDKVLNAGFGKAAEERSQAQVQK